jgi:hypothetical protein
VQNPNDLQAAVMPDAEHDDMPHRGRTLCHGAYVRSDTSQVLTAKPNADPRPLVDAYPRRVFC